MKKVPLLRVILFNVSLTLWTLFLSLICLPILIFLPSRTPILGYVWTCVALFLLKHLCNITYTVRGIENFNPQQVIVASKHQSAMDIVILLHLFKTPAFVLKRELTWIPFWGWYFTKMGMIAINRKKGREALAPLIEQSYRIIQSHRVVAIFPEGTRTPTGEKGRWNPGVGMVYDELKVPLLPLALNTGCYWPRNKWKKFSGTAIVECLPAIPAGLSIRACVKQLEEQIETASRKLYEEANPKP